MTTVNDNPANGTSATDMVRRGQASWRTTVAAGFLGLALVGGLVVALSGGSDNKDAGAPAPAAAAPADLPGNTAEVEPAAPAKSALGDVTWELVSGRAVPTSPTAGPTKVNGPVHAGFAHTQDGAVLAALNIATRAGISPDGNGWLTVLRTQVEPGPGREANIKAGKAMTDWSPPPGGYGQTAGYRIASFSASKAVIEEAVRMPSGQLQLRTMTVIWRDKDWRLVLQPDGRTGPFSAVLADLNGFTPFTAGI